jgi:hypothetical protein
VRSARPSSRRCRRRSSGWLREHFPGGRVHGPIHRQGQGRDPRRARRR